METLSAAAAVINVVEVAGSVAKTTRKLYKELQDAPQQFETFKIDLEHLEQTLNRLADVPNGSNGPYLSTPIDQRLKELLKEAETILGQIHGITSKRDSVKDLKQRWRWVRKDHRTMVKLFQEAKCVKKALDDLAQSVVFHDTPIILADTQEVKSGMAIMVRHIPQAIAGIDEIKSLVSSVVQSTQRCENLLGLGPRQHCVASAQPPTSTAAMIRRLRKRSWSLYRFGLTWGISAVFMTITHGDSKVYTVSLTFSGPLCRIFSAYPVIHFTRQYVASPSPWAEGIGFIFGGYQGAIMMATRMIGGESPLMKACRRNDRQIVKVLVETCGYQLSDLDEKSRNTLIVAITFASRAVVEFILDRAPELVNRAAGALHNTPLHWAVWYEQTAIVALLLAHGAKTDQMNDDGWTPVSLCWPEARRMKPRLCGLTMFQILAGNSHHDLDVPDNNGWTTLQRRAAFGEPDEIAALIQRGADPMMAANELGWNAIQYAVFNGNYGAFLVLEPYFGADLLSMADVRGWTLLHIAAQRGHRDIIRHLLRAGADPAALSTPFTGHMPERLWSGRWTAREVAAAEEPSQENGFDEVMKEVKSFGNVAILRQDAEERWLIARLAQGMSWSFVERLMLLLLGILMAFVLQRCRLIWL